MDLFYYIKNNLDKITAIIGLIISIIFTIYTIFYYHYISSSLSTRISPLIFIIVGTCTLSVCLFWLILKSEDKIFDLNCNPNINFKKCSKIFQILFFSLYILCILSIFLRQMDFQRPNNFFILIICMISVVTYSIFFNKKNIPVLY